MRHHGHELLLGLHADLEILNLLQPAAESTELLWQHFPAAQMY